MLVTLAFEPISQANIATALEKLCDAATEFNEHAFNPRKATI